MISNDNIIIFNEDRYNLVCDNALNYVKSLPENSIQLIVSSPPYNVGKSYELKVSIKEYLNTQKEMLIELVRVLKKEGSICWQVGNYIEKSEVYPLDIFYYEIFKELGLKLRNRIIWHFGHGLHATKRLSGRYETILWFTKSDDYVFNLDNIRVPSKYPNKRHFKGDKKGELSGNPNGKNPSDFWEFLIEEWEGGVWEIPNVKSNHPEKTIHPCQFPVELVERCVLALTNEDDIVLDPYSGVGTTLIASLRYKRKAIGIDKCSEYIEITQERIKSLLKGDIKIRPIGKPIHKPTGKEKIVQIPAEWTIFENSVYNENS